MTENIVNVVGICLFLLFFGLIFRLLKNRQKVENPSDREEILKTALYLACFELCPTKTKDAAELMVQSFMREAEILEAYTE